MEDLMARTVTSERHGHSYRYDKTDWSAAVWAAVIAGVVFMMAEMLMVMFFMGQSPWGPPRMIAAMMMGTNVLPPPADFFPWFTDARHWVSLVNHLLFGLTLGGAYAGLRKHKPAVQP
jgi:hypothetical protein